MTHPHSNPTLSHSLNRTVTIHAQPATVFSFFTDSDRWASWWGAGSTIDARAGGRVFIRYPDGTEVSGEVLEVTPPALIVFTYGFVSGQPIAPGGSRVTIRLEPAGLGTRLRLVHDFAEAQVRDEHEQGWRYQLSVFGNVAANLVNANAAATVDAWFDAWAERDAAAREGRLQQIASVDVCFRDRVSLLDGIADLVPHIGAAQRFMPGMRLKRDGDVRHCQGTLLADWIAEGQDGSVRARGTNVFTLRPDGLIDDVVGFWRA
jgi:uncharacterized protein YndB with AHSA1/START domain